MGIGVTLLGGEPMPLHSLSIVFRHALAVGVHGTEEVLGIGVTLFGGEPKPLHSLGIVFRHTLASGVPEAE